MKHLQKYLAGILAIIVLVAAFPLSAHAAALEEKSKSAEVTVDGTKYSISQSKDTIEVTARMNGKVVDSCTAYLDQGYMVYNEKSAPKNSSVNSSVVWIDDMVSGGIPSTQSTEPMTRAYTAWTKDGKYVYNPTLTSLVPKVYKNHTAYYWFRNVGTEITNRTINIAKGTAVTQVVALLAGIIASVATCGMSTVAALAVTGVITSSGGIITQGIVSRTISPTVGVIATNYQSKFLDASGYGTGAIFKGSKITVKQKSSGLYNKVFYEDYCPQRSEKFAFTAYLNTFKGNFIKYPGLRSYIEL